MVMIFTDEEQVENKYKVQFIGIHREELDCSMSELIALLGKRHKHSVKKNADVQWTLSICQESVGAGPVDQSLQIVVRSYDSII